MTQIGELRDRVSIWRKTRTTDGAGGFIFTWAQVGSAWCSITTLTGRALLMHGGMREKETIVARFRTGTDVRLEDRISWRGINVDILNVTPVAGSPRWIEAQGTIVQAGES